MVIMMIEECLPSLFKSLYVSLILCLQISMFFQRCWYYVMLLMKRELWNVIMRGKYFYVSLSMLNGYETCFENNEESK